MTEPNGPYPLTVVEWWDRQIRMGLGVYFNALNTMHREWQELVGLR